LKKKEKNQDKKNISDCRFVVFDTEATGFYVEKDKMLSIGALELFQNKIEVEKSFELFIQRNDIVGNEAIDVHGILKKGKKTKISEQEAVSQFIAFCGDAILVGHHVGFDIALINKHLQEYYGVKLHNKSIDTAFLARRVASMDNPYLMKRNEELTLDYLAKQYRIDTDDRHKALGDAYITAILFLKLIQKIKGNKPLLTLADVWREKAFGM
jgi:DNA polymerase-3 subunit epsilon